MSRHSYISSIGTSADKLRSNKVDLQLLSEMGVVPDISIHEKKRSFKAVALGVLAMVKMKRRQEEWAESKELQEKLLRKLSVMKRAKRVKEGVR